MRILILANKDGGLYKFRRELIERLVSCGYEVYASIPRGLYITLIEQLGCHVIETEISRHGMNPLQDLQLLQAYRKMIKEVKPDIVFTYTIKPNIYGGMACASRKIPYVVNITGLGTAVEGRGALQSLTYNLYKYGLRNVQTVFFQNTENMDFFQKRKIAAGKYKLLPGSGVNLQFYQPMLYPDQDTTDFVFIGRLMAAKGVDQYLEAARYIHGKYPMTRFHICGSYEEDYEEVINKLSDDGIVIYHGYVEDMRPIYAQVHCVVHPSYYPEGLSNVLLEASASARPVITTDRSGCREVVDDGVNGYIVKQQDSQGLIEKIEKFICLSNEEKKEMGLAGRKKVEHEFDRNIVIDSYLNEIKKAEAGTS